jgi:hypothetical protein
MAFALADRCKETTTTTGTGTYSLGGAVTGYRTFVAGVGSTNQTGYVVEDGTNWEIGLGTVTDLATDTLSRDEILASSNAGAAVNWGVGTKNVFAAPLAALQSSARKLTADLAASTVTTLADVTGLSFPVLSGKHYHFKFLLVYRAAATTTGIKLSVTVPAFTVFSAIADTPVSTAADGTANMFRGHITASDDAVIGTGTPAITTDFIAEIEGVIVPSAGGNVTARFASEVAASGVTIRQGSLGILERIL